MLRIQGTGNKTYEVAEMTGGNCVLLATPDGRTQVAWNEALQLVDEYAIAVQDNNKLLQLLEKQGNRVF